MLLVEDDLDFREHLSFLIESRGHRVETADDGEQAMMHLQVGDLPSIILLDLMMPVMDGWSFRAKLLADERLARIPVAVLSGVAAIRSEAQKLRIDMVLGKPVDLPALYRLLDQHAA